MPSSILPKTRLGWRRWNAVRLVGIAAVVAADLWLRSSRQAHTDVRLEILAALLIVLVFAGRWRSHAFESQAGD